MRITSKGQVTIPIGLREKAGLMPNTEVEFDYDRAGRVTIARASKKARRKSRGEFLVGGLREFGRKHPIKMTTEEIMALMRGKR